MFFNDLELIPGIPGIPESRESPDLPDRVSGAAARDLPSTRAGGQDDVSSKQTPSKEDLRLFVPFKLTRFLYQPILTIKDELQVTPQNKLVHGMNQTLVFQAVIVANEQTTQTLIDQTFNQQFYTYWLEFEQTAN